MSRAEPGKPLHMPTRGAPRAGRLLILCMLALGSGCTLSSLDLSTKACPCATGWTCDERLNQCVSGWPVNDSDAAPRLDGGKPIDSEGGTDRGDGGDTGVPCDAATMRTWWRDGDGDGFGDRAQAVHACTQPPGHVANGDDCDDGETTSYPGAPELCDTLDNDCDPQTNDACPAQCTPRVFDGRPYWFCNTQLSWHDASLACVGGGLSLVSIDSSAENDFVHAGAVELVDGSSVWLGGNDLAGEGVWRWPDGDVFWRGAVSGSAENGAYTKWGVSEPSEATEEDCAEMRAASLWNDARCDALRAFTCERD